MIKIPRGNRTGPWGIGPRTGRGLGYCAGYPSPGYTKGPGMGLGRGYGWSRGGRGGGWGQGRRFYPYPSDVIPLESIPTPFWAPEEESKYLESTLTALKKEIELIEKRIEELANKKVD
ncbi:MAG: DUF5320 domain-containing protein [Candidatus Hodarchaeota archaeon]